MTKNPARTFALVNIAIFGLAIAAVLWLREAGVLGAANDASLLEAARSDSTRAVEAHSALGAVQPARPAQLRFINELLTDTTLTIREAMTVRVPDQAATYYLGAFVAPAEAAQPGFALWQIEGPPDTPRSVRAANDVAEQYSVAGRVRAQDAAARKVMQAATDTLRQRLAAAS